MTHRSEFTSSNTDESDEVSGRDGPREQVAAADGDDDMEWLDYV